MIQLDPVNAKAAPAFLESSLWTDYKKVLLSRAPEYPDSSDAPHTAAAKGFERKGFEAAIALIEALPFEVPEVVQDPFARPALTQED